MRPTIRALEKDDAASYRTCRLNALKLAPTAFSSSFETTSKLPESHFEARVAFEPHSFIFGAFAGDALAGTAGGFVDPEIKCSHIGYVVGMWVEPAYRGQGLSRELLTAVLEQFRRLDGIRTVQLGVTEGNAEALQLYQSSGFREWGNEPDAIVVDGTSYRQIHMALTL